LESIIKHGNPPYEIALLHGGPGAQGDIKPVAKVLSSNMGILELIQTKKTIPELIEELFNQLVSAAAGPVILIGYSWGAWLGFLFAAAYPKMVKKLILVSAGAFEARYKNNMMEVRLKRLSQNEQKEAEELLTAINFGG
jgi:pimeloyl-ACP methyl ester carboxylesterase